MQMASDILLHDRLGVLLDEHKKTIGSKVRTLNVNMVPTGYNKIVPLVYGYVRVSTKKQVLEGHSIEAQTERINEYCTNNNLPEAIIMADDGISGKTTDNREKFNKMRELATSGDTIISYSLSRLGRNSLDILAFVDDLTKNKINLVILDRKIDLSTDQGRLFFNVLTAVNQFEREQACTRTSNVMMAMSKAGKLKTKGPFGYKAAGNKLIPEPEELKVIDYITLLLYDFPDAKESEITRAVQAKVDAGELSMRSKKGIPGKKVYQSTISNIIFRNKLRDLTNNKRN